jgi:HPt (histidine-containing phosphotransfer) domain-containing protein
MRRQLPPLDLDGALDRIAGDRRLFAEIAEIFMNDAPSLLEGVNSALAARDLRRTEGYAHALKGIAANVGGQRVERAALAVEDAARSSQLELARIAAESLAAEVDQLFDALNRSFISTPPGRDE